jgi:hypothetical protein
VRELTHRWASARGQTTRRAHQRLRGLRHRRCAGAPAGVAGLGSGRGGWPRNAILGARPTCSSPTADAEEVEGRTIARPPLVGARLGPTSSAVSVAQGGDPLSGRDADPRDAAHLVADELDGELHPRFEQVARCAIGERRALPAPRVDLDAPGEGPLDGLVPAPGGALEAIGEGEPADRAAEILGLSPRRRRTSDRRRGPCAFETGERES